MRVVVVSSRWPYSTQEPYLTHELRELATHFDNITVVPARPPRGRARELPKGVSALSWPLLSTDLLTRAARISRRHPRRVARSLAQLAESSRRLWLKNASVIVKGLALAQWAEENGAEHIHAYWLSTPATVAMIAGEVAGIPWSATAHRWDIYEQNALEAKARSVRFVRTISARGMQDLCTLTPALSDRTFHVPIGTVVPSEPSWKARSNGRFHVLCPAALVPVKGHDDLLQALAELQCMNLPVQCTIAGEGPLRETLARRVEHLSLEQVVRFAGFVPQSELHEWYDTGAVDLIVLPSREEKHLMEGIPSALIEAMAHGVPVVATSSGSIGELLDDRCGRIVPPKSPHALAQAMLDAYERPTETLTRAVAAYARVAARHEVRRQMSALSERICS
jgi:colanic acid/amylovoran biosynthesis glycosyltransferase